MRIGRLNPPQLLAQSLFWCADSEIIFRPPAMLLGGKLASGSGSARTSPKFGSWPPDPLRSGRSRELVRIRDSFTSRSALPARQIILSPKVVSNVAVAMMVNSDCDNDFST